MRTAYLYNEKGEYIRPVLVNGELPENCTWVAPPVPNWKPVFQNGVWVETATEAEKKPIQEPSEIEERLNLMQQALDDMILGGSL